MNQYSKLSKNFNKSDLSVEKKLENFPNHVHRRDVAMFLNRYEIFKEILPIHGSIIECGVNLGAGLFSWLHFSSILEPYNASRFIIGFDTFSGFKSLDKKKDKHGIYTDKKNFKEFTKRQSIKEIQDSIEIQNNTRPLNDLEKVSLVKGDATKTIPEFIKKNPHTVVSLMHLDFDIYKPSKVAIEKFLPRMPKGSVIALDGTNCPEGPGEAIALLECLDINKVQIKRNSFDSFLCYLLIE
jgi:hypothetical protein|tara:strand:+ start:330 stop:1049 length:720 start_codon:yes stop_codon:yes gene_type:complete